MRVQSKLCNRTIPGLILCPVLVFLLAAGVVSLNAAPPDRSKLPPMEAPAALKLPPIQHLKLANGVPVVLLEKHEVPVVYLGLFVKGGQALDPEGKIGLAQLTASLMTEGAGSRDALQLADAIDFLGARVSAMSFPHAFWVSVSVPVAKLADALPLVADVSLRPTFAGEELERRRRQALNRLLQARDTPSSVASVLFGHTLYGTSHPYGASPFGDEATLRSFTVDDLKKQHASAFLANNATFVVVGDVHSKDLLPKLESAFGQWKPGTVPTPQLAEAKQVDNRAIYLVDKPGAPQSEIRIGRIGAARLTDDYFSLVVLNTILGGSFTSRLNNNLREKHGYTYGAGSSFEFNLLPGPFTIGTAVQTAVTDKALTEIFKELEAIRRPVPAEELERGKNYAALRFPSRFQSVSQIATELRQLMTFGLPDSYFNDYVGRVLRVTQSDVQKAAEKYLDPAKVAIIIVGDREKIEAPLRALNLGPIHLLTIEEVMGKAPELAGKTD